MYSLGYIWGGNCCSRASWSPKDSEITSFPFKSKAATDVNIIWMKHFLNVSKSRQETDVTLISILEASWKVYIWIPHLFILNFIHSLCIWLHLLRIEIGSDVSLLYHYWITLMFCLASFRSSNNHEAVCMTTSLFQQSHWVGKAQLFEWFDSKYCFHNSCHGKGWVEYRAILLIYHPCHYFR